MQTRTQSRMVGSPIHKGLFNVGNTCYLNACLQILCYSPELQLALNKYRANMEHSYQHEVPMEKRWLNWFINEFMILYNKLNESSSSTTENNRPIDPTMFVKLLYKLTEIKRQSTFQEYMQNDVSEFLIFFLEMLHDSIKRPVNMVISGPVKTTKDQYAKDCYKVIQEMCSKEYSEINTIFYGVHMSQIRSVDGKQLLSNKPEPYSLLNLEVSKYDFHPQQVRQPLQITNFANIYECLDNYCRPELLNGDNKWFNESSGQHQDATKQLMFWSFPSVLIIVLKRASLGLRKSRHLIDFPLEGLDLSKYARDYNNKKYVYDLYGICYHHGSSSVSGHYTACVRPFGSPSTWLHYNDTMVTAVDPVDYAQMINPNAYCLFYRQREHST